MRLSDVLRFNLALRGDEPAFRVAGSVLTHREVDLRAGRLAAFLSATAPRGSRICVLLSNCLIYPEIYFACARAGMIIVPMGPQLTEADLARVFGECGPALLITHADRADKARNAAERYGTGLTVLCHQGVPADPRPLPDGWRDYDDTIAAVDGPFGGDVSGAEDPAIILFTSGTTGRPKGVIHSQANFVRGAVTVVSSLGLTTPGRALQVLPIAGINFVWVLSFYIAGLEVEFLQKFDAQKLPRHLSDSRISHVVLAPIMLDLISRDPGAAKGCDFSHLRMLGYGGSRTPREVAMRAIEIYGPVLRQMYGQTEASGLLTSKPAAFHAQDFESAGPPLLGVDIRIVDPSAGDVTATGQTGEILAKVDYALLGYWGRTDIGAPADGWLHTGDTGRITPAGRLVIMGRVDDMIITGGNNVYPREIEDVLAAHPDVSEIAVVGVPDPTWGERVTAFVVASGRRPAHEIEADLKRLAEAELASPKRPRAWQFLEALPRTPTGKVLKTALVSMAGRKSAQVA